MQIKNTLNTPLYEYFTSLKTQATNKRQNYASISLTHIINSIEQCELPICTIEDAARLNGVGKTSLLLFKKYFNIDVPEKKYSLSEPKPIKRKHKEITNENIDTSNEQNAIFDKKGINALVLSTYVAVVNNGSNPVKNADIISQYKELAEFCNCEAVITKVSIIENHMIKSNMFIIENGRISLNNIGLDRAKELLFSNGISFTPVPNIIDDRIVMKGELKKINQNGAVNTGLLAEDMKIRMKNVVEELSQPSSTDGTDELEIIMVLDNREIKAKDDRLYFFELLKEVGIPIERRMLSMGDILWIMRNKVTKQEHVLDYIVERKKMDDLASSIVDGRYDEQRYRLKESGLKPIYLVEGFLSPAVRVSVSLKGLDTAMMNTVVIYSFQLIRTDSASHTVRILAVITKLFQSNVKYYKAKIETLTSYEEFICKNAKDANITIQNLFGKQLRIINGCSADFASAISKIFGTPSNFRKRLKEADEKEEKIKLLNECKKVYLLNENCNLAAVQLSLKGLGNDDPVKKVNAKFLERVIEMYS